MHHAICAPTKFTVKIVSATAAATSKYNNKITLYITHSIFKQKTRSVFSFKLLCGNNILQLH